MANKSASILLVLIFALCGCEKVKSQSVSEPVQPPPILKESWDAYVQRFIQADGRVIDHSAEGISTSEGQAYAMLRAVWIGDRKHFDQTFMWALNNLNSGVRNDHLWAWKWGKDSQSKWRVLDKAFASDADEDAALALILASRVWNNAQYADHARTMLKDLWDIGTIDVAGRRFLLAGDSLCRGETCRINPSYYAPYAYRIFAEFDRERDWAALVETSYHVLEAVSALAETGLPADWVQLNTKTGEITEAADGRAFSYDAFRVYWRVALDRDLFREARAERYLSESLRWISTEWEKQHKLPAVISPAGKALVQYESLEMISALMCAMRNEAMQAKLRSAYSKGAWADKDKYYLQNWAWFGTAVYNRYLGPFELIKPRA